MSEYQPYRETAKELLDDWDAGKSCWTVEMGGIGPGYEQAIHVAAFEVIRDMHATPFPDSSDTEATKRWIELAEAAVSRANKFPNMGLSGAQAGAAIHLASMFIKHGHRNAMAKAETNRRIQVGQSWPRRG